MEAQSLHKVGQLLDVLERTTGEPGELTSTLQHIAETAQRFFALDGCVIYAINPITGRFVESLTIEGDLVESATLFEQPGLEGVTQKVLQQGILLVERLEECPEYCSSFTRAKGMQAFVGLALYMKYGQKPLGVLYLDFKDPQHFSPDDHELFQLFAEQASYILQETWLVRRYREVARMGQEINQELATVEVLFQKLQQHVTGILDVSYTLLLAIYLSPINMLRIYMYEEGETFVYNNLAPTGAIQHVIEKQQTFFGQHMSREEKEKQLPFQRVLMLGTRERESVIFVPLVLRGVSLGALSIQHPEPNVYNKEDRFILELLGNHIALALYNMRLYDSLYSLNETGQFLTQQINSAQVLQETVDKIWRGTEANSVILYPYDSTLQRFELPPRVAGLLLDSTPLHSTFLQPHDIAVQALNYAKPIFAKQGVSIYATLRDNLYVEEVNFQQREKVESVVVIPLRVGEVSVGVLFLNFRQPQHFDTPQKLLIEGMAHYAAIAIKNAQAFGTLSLRRIHELEILQYIDRELNRTLELESILNIILKLAREHVASEEASILLYNPQTHVLETVAASGRYAEAIKMQAMSFERNQGITGWVVEHKKSARVNNVHKDSPWRDLYFPVATSIVSELDVPLLDGEEVIGVINFESIREGAFYQEDEDFLLALAGQAVLAIKKAQAYEREKRLAEEGQVLNEISKEITSQLDTTHIFGLILEKALLLTRSTGGNLMIYDSERNDLWMAAERGVSEDKKGQRQSLDQGVVGHIARNKQLLNIMDLSQPPWNEVNLDFIPGTRSELATPMLAGNDLLGVLNVESRLPNNFTESDERLLKGLADLAVIALQNAQAYEREKRLAEEGQVLNEISKEITSQLDTAHIFGLILEKALLLTRSTVGNLMIYDSERNDLWMAAERGVSEDKKGQRQSLDQGIVGYIARNKQLLNIMDLSQPPWDEVYLGFIPGARSELATPMLAGNDLLGVLNIESRLPNNFIESDERLLKGLADLAVIALQNAQAYEREKRLAEEGQVLNEISKEITSQLDTAHIFGLILEKALMLTRSTVGNVMIYDSKRNDLWMAAERGVSEDKKGQRQKRDQGIVSYVAAHKQPCNVEDISQPPWNTIYLELAPGVHSELAVPMLQGNELRGVLNVESLVAKHFNEKDVRLLRGLADLAVIALQNAEHYRKAEQERQRFELLYEAGQELSKVTEWATLEQAYDIILRIAEGHSHSQAVIYSYDKDTQELVMIHTSESQTSPLFSRRYLDLEINRQVAQERRTLVIHDTTNPPLHMVSTQLSDPATRSLFITPIMFKEQYYGNLGLRHKEVGHFRSTDSLFFEGLAQQLASTIYRLETAQSRQEFEKRALSAEEMSSIGQSAFEVTHRLGNDLGLVEFYVSDIQAELEGLGITNPFVDEKLKDIVQSVKAVLSFSKDLKKELAKLGDEKMAGEPVLISPKELLEEASTALSLPLNIEIGLEIDDPVSPVKVFRSLVADILRNLVANAIQAMPDGGKITLRTRNVGRSVALEVADTGVGIPQQKLANIFDLFFSTKGSSGFGLWSARRNALKNRGDLKVVSQLGQGTTFQLLLPRIDSGMS